MTVTVPDIAASAHEVMAAWPSDLGWQRIESTRCGGSHRVGSDMGGQLVVWRRKRNLFSKRFEILDEADDPKLWVAEHIRPTLCASPQFYWANMTIGPLMGQPWSFSGKLAAGTVVKLDVANGSWRWVLQGEPDCECGGWLARWPD